MRIPLRNIVNLCEIVLIFFCIQGPNSRYLGTDAPKEDLIWQDPVPNGFVLNQSEVEELKKKIITIQKKCQKYNCKFNFDILNYEFKTIKDNTGKDCIIKFYKVF